MYAVMMFGNIVFLGIITMVMLIRMNRFGLFRGHTMSFNLMYQRFFKYLSHNYFVAQYEPVVNNIVSKGWCSYVVLPR